MSGLFVDWLERTCVEFLVEIGDTFISNLIESSTDSIDQPILSQLWETVLGMPSRRATEVFHSLRSQIAVLAEQFKNRIVGWHHPLRALAHVIRRLGYSTHNTTECPEIRSYDPYTLGYDQAMLSITQQQAISTQQ